MRSRAKRFWLGPAAMLVVAGMHGNAVAREMTFQAACQPGKRVTIAAVGDLLFHNSLMRLGMARRDFKPFWRQMAPVLAAADIAYGNLEGPAVRNVAIGGRPARDPGWKLDYRVYGYRRGSLIFNFHPQVILDMKATGFDIVSTANNHAMDRGWRGANGTIDNLEAAGLALTGTRKRDGDARAWSTIVERNGIRTAWLACTYSTNGMPDRHGQVLMCYDQREKVLAEIRRLASDTSVDAVLVTPHWGAEYRDHPTGRQKRLARDMIDAGATAVLGGHPHVVQPWEKRVTTDGREGLIVYSLGNFVSNMIKWKPRVSIVMLLELGKTGDAKAVVTGAGYIPTFFEISSRRREPVEVSQKSRAGRHVARLLPAGNRVTRQAFRTFPKACPVTVAAQTAAASAKVGQRPAVPQKPGAANGRGAAGKTVRALADE